MTLDIGSPEFSRHTHTLCLGYRNNHGSLWLHDSPGINICSCAMFGLRPAKPRCILRRPARPGHENPHLYTTPHFLHDILTCICPGCDLFYSIYRSYLSSSKRPGLATFKAYYRGTALAPYLAWSTGSLWLRFFYSSFMDGHLSYATTAHFINCSFPHSKHASRCL